MLEFRDENTHSVISQINRMCKDGILLKLRSGFYAEAYVKHNRGKVIVELSKELRPADQFYLSLEYRALELGMILQVPNEFYV